MMLATTLALALFVQDPASDARKQIRDMSIDVQWSKVPFETCLVRTYERARKEGKPVLIWALAGDPEGRC